MIFVNYDKTQIELLFAQSLQIICSVYVGTPRVILLVTIFFITIESMVIIELYKPRATHMKYIEGNEEFSKSKTTKLFYFTRYSRLIFQS